MARFEYGLPLSRLNTWSEAMGYDRREIDALSDAEANFENNITIKKAIFIIKI